LNLVRGEDGLIVKTDNTPAVTGREIIDFISCVEADDGVVFPGDGIITANTDVHFVAAPYVIVIGMNTIIAAFFPSLHADQPANDRINAQFLPDDGYGAAIISDTARY